MNSVATVDQLYTGGGALLLLRPRYARNGPESSAGPTAPTNWGAGYFWGGGSSLARFGLAWFRTGLPHDTERWTVQKKRAVTRAVNVQRGSTFLSFAVGGWGVGGPQAVTPRVRNAFLDKQTNKQQHLEQ